MQWEETLPEILRKRARHVVTDNVRVLEAAKALRSGDLHTVGAAMCECHESLRDDYQVSSPELDLVAETAWAVPGCYGARLTGAGFGGCVVALVQEDAVDTLSHQVGRAYAARFQVQPTVTVCRTADGVSAEPV
jgi:galactokinase